MLRLNSGLSDSPLPQFRPVRLSSASIKACQTLLCLSSCLSDCPLPQFRFVRLSSASVKVCQAAICLNSGLSDCPLSQFRPVKLSPVLPFFLCQCGCLRRGNSTPLFQLLCWFRLLCWLRPFLIFYFSYSVATGL